MKTIPQKFQVTEIHQSWITDRIYRNHASVPTGFLSSQTENPNKIYQPLVIYPQKMVLSPNLGSGYSFIYSFSLVLGLGFGSRLHFKFDYFSSNLKPKPKPYRKPYIL